MADRGTAGSDRLVRAVAIAGNQAIDDEPIIDGLATRPPEGILFRTYQPLDPLSLQVDADRIVHYYNTRGYFSAKVMDTQVRDADGRFVKVVFTVEEGRPARIAAVRFEGVPDDMQEDMPAQQLAGAVREGERFEYQAYEQAKQRLRAWLLERGHAYAQVDGRIAVDRDAGTARVRFLLRPGPVARFGDTRVLGLEDVPERAVLARLAWKPGQRFDPEKIERTRARLYELGLFGYVRIDYARGALPGEQPARMPEVVDMRIRVTEIATHDLRLGGGIGIAPRHWELRARVSYTHRSFLDPLLVLRLDAMPGYAFRRAEGGRRGFGGRARLTAQRADLFYPRVYLRAVLGYDQVTTELYQASGASGRLELYRSFLDGRLLAGAGWELAYYALSEITPAVRAIAPELGLVDPYRSGAFDQRVIYDRRDSIAAPTRGLYAELRLEEGGAPAGGGFSYVRATGELRGYVPLTSPRLVLAGRVRHGRALSGNLPITRRYVSGGATSHRGFAQGYLSPVPADVRAGMPPAGSEQGGDGTQPGTDLLVPIGGNALLETSAELRWDFLRPWGNWLSMAVFVDGGDVPLRPGGLDLANLHWAVGGGLRYDTAVGPVRADVGYRVTRIGESAAGRDRWAFHLTLGEAF